MAFAAAAEIAGQFLTLCEASRVSIASRQCQRSTLLVGLLRNKLRAMVAAVCTPRRGRACRGRHVWDLHAQRCRGGQLWLHAAARRASAAVVRLLLETYSEGAKAKDVHGFLPLHVAEVRMANSNGGVERMASVDVIAVLLDSYGGGAQEPLQLSLGFGPGRLQQLPLHYALRNHALVEVVRALLDAHREGARVRDDCGQLPLHIAVERNASLDVLRLLLDAHREGARAKGWVGAVLPLHVAAGMKASIEVVQMLLDAYREGARVEEGKFGELPLHRVVGKPRPPPVEGTYGQLPSGAVPPQRVVSETVVVVQALLGAHREGAQAKDVFGRLPLHVAVAARASIEVVQALLDAHREGAQAKDRFGRLPLHVAILRKAPLAVIQALTMATARSWPQALT